MIRIPTLTRLTPLLYVLVAACGGGEDAPVVDPEVSIANAGQAETKAQDGTGQTIPGYAKDGVALGEVRGEIEDYPAKRIADSEIRCMALGLYHEARAEPEAGLWAVGHVIMNRMESKRYPDTACGVTKDGGAEPPCQFSWFCDGRDDTPKETEAWENARVLARKLLTGQIPDVTNGATSFHAATVSPYWADRMTRTKRIGGHIFYRRSRG